MLRRLILVAMILFSAISQSQTRRAPQIDHIVVHKRAHRMELMLGGKVIKSYAISLGPEIVGHKQQEGDGRTPEGDYIIDSKTTNTHYHKALHISYPNASDVASAKKRGVSPGGNILIHGLPNGYDWIGRGQRLADWTAGCISVSNEEIDEIYALTPLKTPITIHP